MFPYELFLLRIICTAYHLTNYCGFPVKHLVGCLFKVTNMKFTFRVTERHYFLNMCRKTFRYQVKWHEINPHKTF